MPFGSVSLRKSRFKPSTIIGSSRSSINDLIVSLIHWKYVRHCLSIASVVVSWDWKEYHYISLHINHAQPLAHIKAQHDHIRLQELPVYRACGVVKLESKRTIAKLYIINKRLVAITERRNVFVGLLCHGAFAYPPGICLAWIDYDRFKTYEKNVDFPHPASPRNRIETTGESGSESAIEWWLNSERRTDV